MAQFWKWIDGNKTYALILAFVAWKGWQWFTGVIDGDEFFDFVFGGGAAMAARHAIAKTEQGIRTLNGG